MADDVDETKKMGPSTDEIRSRIDSLYKMHQGMGEHLEALRMYRPSTSSKPDSGMSPLGGKAK
jgi:hypothetical protein